MRLEMAMPATNFQYRPNPVLRAPSLACARHWRLRFRHCGRSVGFSRRAHVHEVRVGGRVSTGGTRCVGVHGAMGGIFCSQPGEAHALFRCVVWMHVVADDAPARAGARPFVCRSGRANVSLGCVHAPGRQDRSHGEPWTGASAKRRHSASRPGLSPVLANGLLTPGQWRANYLLGENIYVLSIRHCWSIRNQKLDPKILNKPLV